MKVPFFFSIRTDQKIYCDAESLVEISGQLLKTWNVQVPGLPVLSWLPESSAWCLEKFRADAFWFRVVVLEDQVRTKSAQASETFSLGRESHLLPNWTAQISDFKQRHLRKSKKFL